MPDWAHIGYPVIECQRRRQLRRAPSRPAPAAWSTPAVIAEQMLYEIGDPRALPAARRRLRLQPGDAAAGGRAPRARCAARAAAPPDRQLQGLRDLHGRLPLHRAAHHRRHRCRGQGAPHRRSDPGAHRALLQQAGLADYTATHIEVLGSESGNYGPHARAGQTREAVLHLAVTHPHKEALELFAREIAPAGTRWSPGTTGAGGGRLRAVAVDPAVRLPAAQGAAGSRWSAWASAPFAVPQPAGDRAPRRYRDTGGRQTATAHAACAERRRADTVEVPLIRLAWARSGDKGDISNIGVIARTARMAAAAARAAHRGSASPPGWRIWCRAR